MLTSRDVRHGQLNVRSLTVRCLKDEDLGTAYATNVYYCEDPNKPVCCQRNDEHTCCEDDNKKTWSVPHLLTNALPSQITNVATA